MRRVGGIRDRKVDVRILAATNRDLEREVRRERFRSDLYFRLAVIILHLPPLRERGEDVLLLAEHYLQQFSAKYGRDIRRIDARAREQLLAYPWPGNVRELSHVIERGVLWSRGPILEVEHLSLTSPAEAPELRTPAAAGNGDVSETAATTVAPDANDLPPLRPTSGALPKEGMDLAQWERAMIEQALREAGGNQTRAAQRLGISRDTLRYRLKKFGIHG